MSSVPAEFESHAACVTPNAFSHSDWLLNPTYTQEAKRDELFAPAEKKAPHSDWGSILDGLARG